MTTMKDDTISRAAAIDAVNNMIRRKFGISADLGTGALLELPSATDTNVGGNLIDRQAAIKAADSIINRDTSGNNDVVKAMTAWQEYIKALPSAQPGQRNAIVFQGIVVEYPSISAYPEYEGKPYFSIKYTENGQEFIGYGTYKPEVLSEFLKEYFMSPAQPNLSEAYSKAVLTWLMDYQIRAAELKGRYTPYEVLSWVANDWRKEHERFD